MNPLERLPFQGGAPVPDELFHGHIEVAVHAYIGWLEESGAINIVRQKCSVLRRGYGLAHNMGGSGEGFRRSTSNTHIHMFTVCVDSFMCVDILPRTDEYQFEKTARL